MLFSSLGKAIQAEMADLTFLIECKGKRNPPIIKEKREEKRVYV